MLFSVYLPPKALAGEDVPAVYCLAGLTCNQDTFLFKSGAEQHAARLGIALVCPDTSPRGIDLPGITESWDFGLGAGFYLNATHPTYAQHFNMHAYITQELTQLVSTHLPVDPDRISILGHSMGGHGALVAALKHPGKYRSVSALAPICHPSACPWGEKAFKGYLKDAEKEGMEWDATLLLPKYEGHQYELPILIDQGSEDKFLHQGQLLPEKLVEAAASSGVVEVTLRMRDGYDHGYYFIKTFIAEHLEHHARWLGLDPVDVDAGESNVGEDVRARRDTMT